MSFLKKLFGLGDAPAADTPAAADAAVEYNGYAIEAAPFSEGGQFQTAGVIRKQIGGEMREHRFVRADRFPSRDAAADMALRKARQIIDEQGDRLFG